MPGETGQHSLLSTIVSFLNQVFNLLFMANDSETNNRVCQAMLASFAKALEKFRNYPMCHFLALFPHQNNL